MLRNVVTFPRDQVSAAYSYIYSSVFERVADCCSFRAVIISLQKKGELLSLPDGCVGLLRGSEMMNYTVLGALTSLFMASAALAEQRIELNMKATMDARDTFELDDSGFYYQDSESYSEVVEGPFEDGPSRCLGSGFYFKDGTNDIGGICIYGEGTDTFTIKWKAGEQGTANTWTVVAGTGKYRGMTGEGIATTKTEQFQRLVRLVETHVVGTVTMPD